MPEFTPEEEWRPVVGYEGLYEVSNVGRVRRAASGKIMAARARPRGYVHVALSRRGRQQPVDVHVLVAAAFIGPRPDGYQVNHLDGNKANPRPENLEYVTRSENMLHARRVLGIGRGQDHAKAKLADADVHRIRAECGRTMADYRRFAAAFGVDWTSVAQIVRGKTWRHLLTEGCESPEAFRFRDGSVVLTFNGETRSQAEWGRLMGMDGAVICKRLRRGWSVADALTRPLRVTKR